MGKVYRLKEENGQIAKEEINWLRARKRFEDAGFGVYPNLVNIFSGTILDSFDLVYRLDNTCITPCITLRFHIKQLEEIELEIYDIRDLIIRMLHEEITKPSLNNGFKKLREAIEKFKLEIRDYYMIIWRKFTSVFKKKRK